MACLEALLQQQLSSDVSVEVFLVDDGSTDGTSTEVLRRFPDVQILKGDGSLYWNGGMRVAFQEAAKEGFDYYLWINDDTTLLPTALESLLQTQLLVDVEGRREAIIVGSLCEKESGQLTYGGVIRASRWHRMRFKNVQPSDVPQPCETMNGNCVLISAAVANALGNLSPAYYHGMGDYDYGLRAKKHGFSVWVAPKCLGFCSRNKISGTWQDTTLGFSQRWKILTGPKGLPPNGWMSFCRAHTGPLWLLFFLAPYVRLFSSLIHPRTVLKFIRRFVREFRM